MKFSLFYFTTENQKKRKDKNTENTQMQCGEEAQKEQLQFRASYSSLVEDCFEAQENYH